MRTIFVTTLLSLTALLFIPACSGKKAPVAAERPRIAVSLPPYQYFVERLGGDLFEVAAIVPPGADPHTFEATPRQAEKLSQARVWFAIGEPFERRLTKSLTAHNRELVIADLREAWERPVHHHAADDEGHHSHQCCHCHLEDRHFWMSPKRAGQQVQFIAKTLTRVFPEHSEIIERRLQLLKKDLDTLASDLTTQLSQVENRWMLVSHPALGYFCEDFNLHQLSLEVEGKEPTPQQLAHLLEQAKQLPVGCVMTQSQHNPAGAQWVANQLGVESQVIDPYHPDVLSNLRRIAKVFIQSQKQRLQHTATPSAVQVQSAAQTQSIP